MNATRNLIIAGAVALTLAACGSDTASTPTTIAAVATTAPAAATTTAAAAATTTGAAATTTGAASTAPAAAGATAVSIGDFKFQPAAITVKVGDSITWTNNHTQPHTATSSGNFDTGSLAPGESKAIAFDKAGSFAYICSFHPFMTGTVTVA